MPKFRPVRIHGFAYVDSKVSDARIARFITQHLPQLTNGDPNPVHEVRQMRVQSSLPGVRIASPQSGTDIDGLGSRVHPTDPMKWAMDVLRKHMREVSSAAAVLRLDPDSDHDVREYAVQVGQHLPAVNPHESDEIRAIRLVLLNILEGSGLEDLPGLREGLDATE